MWTTPGLPERSGRGRAELARPSKYPPLDPAGAGGRALPGLLRRGRGGSGHGFPELSAWTGLCLNSFCGARSLFFCPRFYISGYRQGRVFWNALQHAFPFEQKAQLVFYKSRGGAAANFQISKPSRGTALPVYSNCLTSYRRVWRCGCPVDGISSVASQRCELSF